MKAKLFFWIVILPFGIIGLACSVRAEDRSLYDPHDRRDPFVPLITLNSRQASGLMGIESADDVIIEGIVYDPKGSVVVLNGSVMKEGEEQGNLKILKIEPTGVRVSISGTESLISLYSDEPKGKTSR